MLIRLNDIHHGEGRGAQQVRALRKRSPVAMATGCAVRRAANQLNVRRYHRAHGSSMKNGSYFTARESLYVMPQESTAVSMADHRGSNRPSQHRQRPPFHPTEL